MRPSSDAAPFDADAPVPRDGGTHRTSPDAQLAARIAGRLLADGLIVAAEVPALGEQLALGQLSKAQWRELLDAAAFDGVLDAARPMLDRPDDA